jgi:Porin subfamily
MNTPIRIPLLAALALSAAAFQAGAEDRPDSLPGVDGTFSVLGPAAEPETESVVGSSPYGEGFVRIPGTDTYVRISGMVRYDVEFTGRNKKAARPR